MSKGKVLDLTGGGPAPGHNAVIYAATKRLLTAGYEVFGCLDGWKGLIQGKFKQLGFDDIDRVFLRGGTIIGTSRTDLRKYKMGEKKLDVTADAAEIVRSLNFTAVIALGGNDTTSVAADLYAKYNVPVICGPKTIDNDLWGTCQSYGFDTAANTVAKLIASMHDDFASTHYVGVFEVMGRDNGSLPLYSGVAGGAHVVLIPEYPQTIESVVARINAAHLKYGYCIVVVAEELNMPELKKLVEDGAEKDAFGNTPIAKRKKGWSQIIAEEIQKRSALEARHIVIGHLCRGGSPSVADTIMCLRIGTKLFNLIEERSFGHLVTWGDPPGIFPLVDTIDSNGVGRTRVVSEQIYNEMMALLPI